MFRECVWYGFLGNHINTRRRIRDSQLTLKSESLEYSPVIVPLEQLTKLRATGRRPERVRARNMWSGGIAATVWEHLFIGLVLITNSLAKYFDTISMVDFLRFLRLSSWLPHQRVVGQSYLGGRSQAILVSEGNTRIEGGFCFCAGRSREASAWGR